MNHHMKLSKILGAMLRFWDVLNFVFFYICGCVTLKTNKQTCVQACDDNIPSYISTTYDVDPINFTDQYICQRNPHQYIKRFQILTKLIIPTTIWNHSMP